MEKIINFKGEDLFIDDAGFHYKEEDCKGGVDKDQLETAKLFIDLMAKKRNSINKYDSSYGLKHKAENFGGKLNSEYDINTVSYVSNGALILAAYILGFTVFTPPGVLLNCYFNLTIR